MCVCVCVYSSLQTYIRILIHKYSNSYLKTFTIAIIPACPMSLFACKSRRVSLCDVQSPLYCVCMSTCVSLCDVRSPFYIYSTCKSRRVWCVQFNKYIYVHTYICVDQVWLGAMCAILSFDVCVCKSRCVSLCNVRSSLYMHKRASLGESVFSRAVLYIWQIYRYIYTDIYIQIYIYIYIHIYI